MKHRASSAWRVLVHDMVGRRSSGTSHHIQSDQLRQPAAIDEHQTVNVLPNTDLDEVVIGAWIHLEQMDTGSWWMNIGGVTVLVRADPKGHPTEVHVFGPDDYDVPVKGVAYCLTWTGEVKTSKEWADDHR